MKFLILSAFILLATTVGILRSEFLTFRPSPSNPLPSTSKNRFLSFLKTLIFFLVILPLSYLEMLVEVCFYSQKKSSNNDSSLLNRTDYQSKSKVSP
jgi:hypothetical protein